MNAENRFATFVKRYGAGAALLVALTATLGSLYYSEIVGFIPCTLCWYQRILMYPLTLITLVALVRKDPAVDSYVLPLALIGSAISAYHYLLQQGYFGESTACTVGVPCNVRYVNYFGFVSIPLMALTAFVLIIAIMALMSWANSRS